LPEGFALDAQSRVFGAAGGVVGGNGAASGAAPKAASQPATTFLPSPAPPLNAVHALDANGRVGSAVIGLWFLLGRTDTIGVRFGNADANKGATLLLTSGGSTARVIMSGRTDSVRVARTSCPR
jgi:hypothetical protein